MKQASLLFALCLLFGLSAVAQTTTTVDNTTKRITITTKKVDDQGKAVTETWIAEGDEPAKLLEEMAVNPEIIQQVTIEGDVQKVEGERLFLFRSAGDQVTIEGTLDPLATPLNEQNDIIIITRDGNEKVITENKVGYWHGNGGKNQAHAYVNVGEKKYNCAALGVYADARGEITGAQISRLIDQGAAQQAGLKEGDIIRYIDGFEVNDFSTLFAALSNFRPGDRVTVKYERDGKALKVKADLKGWSELPGYEHMSRSDCGQPDLSAEMKPDTRSDEPGEINDIETLELQDARIYPNPSDGVFSFSFNTKPGPLTVAITDVNGKVVYSDRNENPSGTYQNDINIKDMPQGNYIITVNQGDKFYTQQISKQ